MNKTYFIRHTSDMDIDAATLAQLWAERRMAIHFSGDVDGKLNETDNASLNPNDYTKSGKKAFNVLIELAEHGGYVCAQYHGHTKVLLGKVPAGTTVELFEGRWGTMNGLQGRTAILKTVKLESVVEAEESDNVALLVGRPQQGTLMRWKIIKDRVADIVEGRPSKSDLSNLSPSELEVLCGEFLRLPIAEKLGLPMLACLKLSIGKTLKDIDLYGVDVNGKILVAQVTYHTTKKKIKLERLQKFADGGMSVILFCQTEQFQTRDGIHYAPIDKVFEAFRNTEVGRLWFSSRK